MSLVEIHVVNSETKPVILSLNYVYATDIHLSSVQHETYTQCVYLKFNTIYNTHNSQMYINRGYESVFDIWEIRNWWKGKP